MDLQRDREGLLAFLSRDFIVEPYHHILSLPHLKVSRSGLQSPEIQGALWPGAAWQSRGRSSDSLQAAHSALWPVDHMASFPT